MPLEALDRFGVLPDVRSVFARNLKEGVLRALLPLLRPAGEQRV